MDWLIDLQWLVCVRRSKIRQRWASLSRNYETNKRNGDGLKKRNDNDELLLKTPSIFSNRCIKHDVLYKLQCNMILYTKRSGTAGQFQKWAGTADISAPIFLPTRLAPVTPAERLLLIVAGAAFFSHVHTAGVDVDKKTTSTRSRIHQNEYSVR